MSSYRKQTVTTIPRVPCCKVCKDSGEPESVYSSHYVKDRDGNVICPKLKKIACLNCGKNGHTSSYCKVVVKKEEPNAKSVVAKPATAPVATGSSRFACLINSDSDSDDDEKLIQRKHTKPVRNMPAPEPREAPKRKSKEVKSIISATEFPALSVKSTARTVNSPSISYAGMVSKPVEPKRERHAIVLPEIPKRPASPKTRPPIAFKYMASSILDWANPDISDSEDEESDSEDEE